MGFYGPVPLFSTSSAGRDYSLKALFHEGWASPGMRDIPNQNAGSPLGVGIAIECRSNQERIIAADAYSRKRIPIQTKTLLSRVVIEAPDDKKVTIGIEIANGRIVSVPREAIVSARALHHPQSAIAARHGT